MHARVMVNVVPRPHMIMNLRMTIETKSFYLPFLLYLCFIFDIIYAKELFHQYLVAGSGLWNCEMPYIEHKESLVAGSVIQKSKGYFIELKKDLAVLSGKGHNFGYNHPTSSSW